MKYLTILAALIAAPSLSLATDYSESARQDAKVSSIKTTHAGVVRLTALSAPLIDASTYLSACCCRCGGKPA